MVDLLEVNGINEKQSLLLARFLIEPKDQTMVAYSEDAVSS
jgi:hypothetical protein